MKFPQLWTDNCADLLRAFNKEGVEYLWPAGSLRTSDYWRTAPVKMLRASPCSSDQREPALPASSPPSSERVPSCALHSAGVR